jgi:hypothetical protein
MKHPYRTPDAKTPGQNAPTRLVYRHVDRAAKQSMGGAALLQLTPLPLLVGAVAYRVFGEYVGPLLFAVAAFAMYVWWRRRTGALEFVLRVDRGALLVESQSIHETIRLTDLQAVELETKTIQRVHEGDSLIPAMRLDNTKVGGDIDTCRVLLRTQSVRVRLGEQYIAHMDAVEGVGKIRVFLRKNGWIPEDERKEAAAAGSALPFTQ